MLKISVVSTFYNEEENIKALYKRLRNVFSNSTYKPEFIFVENGSYDRTFEIIKELADSDNRIKIIKLSRNFGYQMGYTAGLENVSPDTSAVVMIDGDLQDQPELIRDFIKKWEEGYDVVYGIRKKRKGSFIKNIFYKLYYKILSSLSDIDIPKDSGEFCLIDAKAWKMLLKFGETNRLLRGLRAWVGFKQIGIEYTRDERKKGKTKFNFFQLVTLGLDGIFSFSSKPLQIAANLGLFIMMFALGSTLYFVFWYFFASTKIPGYASTNIIILTIGGINLFFLGIIGEYIRRIFDEVKGRPKYIIDMIYSNDKMDGVRS